MRFEQEIRETLVNNAIRLIAEGGFEKATTKALTYSGEQSPDITMNEVYIYRFFGGKEGLYETAFVKLDTELLLALREAVSTADDIKIDTKNKLYNIFLRSWRFVLRNEANCRCYVRYYYSVYFNGPALKKHNKHFDVIVNAFSPLFIEEADVRSIMHSVLTALLDFAVRVYNGDLEDSDVNTPHVFNVLYCIMASYFKDEIKTGANMSPCI